LAVVSRRLELQVGAELGSALEKVPADEHIAPIVVTADQAWLGRADDPKAQRRAARGDAGDDPAAQSRLVKARLPSEGGLVGVAHGLEGSGQPLDLPNGH